MKDGEDDPSEKRQKFLERNRYVGMKAAKTACSCRLSHSNYVFGGYVTSLIMAPTLHVTGRVHMVSCGQCRGSDYCYTYTCTLSLGQTWQCPLSLALCLLNLFCG